MGIPVNIPQTPESQRAKSRQRRQQQQRTGRDCCRSATALSDDN
ncbi:MAG TPA: hypothetical protein VGM03_16620 [Phycisphaerae bacterium]